MPIKMHGINNFASLGIFRRLIDIANAIPIIGNAKIKFLGSQRGLSVYDITE
ncbi:hypothetical protein VYA_44950 (plasmid) [Vibrio alfacsensis]|nr:hypothetical protein VYA_44950 [Vibrio alfacsensis]